MNNVKFFFILTILNILSIGWAEPPSVSFDFQNIQVRSALQLIGQLTQKNIAISEKVKGRMTLYLQHVHYGEVFQFILDTQDLATYQQGNIWFIAPRTDIEALKTARLQAEKNRQNWEALTTQIFEIKYGTVDTYFDLLSDPKQNLLSPRGQVYKLNRVNRLIVKDIPVQLKEIAILLKKIDQPVEQVLIETQIVYINTSYEKRLGIKWGSPVTPATSFQGFNMDLSPGGLPLGHTSAMGRLAIGLSGLVNLNLELQAIEAEGNGKLLSSPKILTSNNTSAHIEQGQQIPYTVSAPNGGTAIQMVPAMLRLQVRPQILPNKQIKLSLAVTQDQLDTTKQIAGQAPPINTRQLETKIQIKNRQTIVLGGIYEQTQAKNKIQLPGFNRIPLIGHLFKSTTTIDNKSELLIFITPKIIE